MHLRYSSAPFPDPSQVFLSCEKQVSASAQYCLLLALIDGLTDSEEHGFHTLQHCKLLEYTTPPPKNSQFPVEPLKPTMPHTF